jgi:hypothetical protein
MTSSVTSIAESRLLMILLPRAMVLSYPALDSNDRRKYMTMQFFLLHICMDVFPWIPEPRQLWLTWKHDRSFAGLPMDWDVAALALESDGADVFEFLPLSTSASSHRPPSSSSPLLLLPPNSYFLDRLSIRVYEKLLVHWTFQLFVEYVRQYSYHRTNDGLTMTHPNPYCEQNPLHTSSSSSFYHGGGSCCGDEDDCFPPLEMLNVPDLLIHIGSYVGALTRSQLELLQETVPQLETTPE